MAGIKHLFTSATPDSADPALVNPSNWNAVHDIPATGIQIGDAATNEMTAVAASAGPSGGLQYLRRNVTNSAYEFVAPLVASVADYNWSQAPGGSVAIGTNTITLTPVPLGVSGTNVGHRIYLSNGVGAAEPVLIIGGTAASGATSGTLIFTAVNTHSGAWTVSSASFGLQEAINVVGVAGGGTVKIGPGVFTLNGTVTIAHSNITVNGSGGMCCDFGTTIARTGNFGDSIAVGSSTLQANMISLYDFALDQKINYVQGNPGTISNKPTSGAHIRLWGSNTVNIARVRAYNMVQNIVITGASAVTIRDCGFFGLWDPYTPALQVTSATILVEQLTSGYHLSIPTYISLINNLYNGYQAGVAPSVPYAAGPLRMVHINAAEDLYIDGGSFGPGASANVLFNAQAPFILFNIRIQNVKFDSAGEFDIIFFNDGVSTSSNILISDNVFNGEFFSANAIKAVNPGSGAPPVRGLVVSNNSMMAYLRSPLMFLDGVGLTITGNSIRFYNALNGYATAADSSAMYFGQRADKILATGNQLGGGQEYAPFGSGGNWCNFGISIESPALQQNFNSFANSPASQDALGSTFLGNFIVQNYKDVTNSYFLIGKNDGGSADGVYVLDDRGAAGVNSGKTLRVVTRNDGLNDTGAIASFETIGGSTITVLRVGIDGNVGIGTGAPATSAKLELSGTTGALLITRLTTAERNALTAVNGMLIYNTTLAKFQGYEAGAWTNLI
jgi:hypothetical protein